ncbi:hypothetical protein D9756_010202 [Leucocoprinus leucothites]|uniref:Ubiquitin-like modifier-activating enzyme Atg7 N-terminal domain-containing protein n=1 Tax=Leucocoprinus leucothites TaxID=201217 RepID=A0A8H5CTU3_9AGAR|nr:hypothetical protein D9756_010202 [Leucoagaricus leucothites]
MIDTLKLADDVVNISAPYFVGCSVLGQESSKVIVLRCAISIGPDSFSSDTHPHPGNDLLRGNLKNPIQDHVLSTHDSSLLNLFLLISFANLKKYRYHYWFAYSAFVAKPAWEIANSWSPASNYFSPNSLPAIQAALSSQPAPLPFFLVHDDKVTPVEDFKSFFTSVPSEDQIVAFIAPSTAPASPLATP